MTLVRYDVDACGDEEYGNCGAVTADRDGDWYKAEDVEALLAKLHVLAESDKCGAYEAWAIWDIIGPKPKTTAEENKP